MKTAAVVVDWGRPSDTAEALRSLSQMGPPPDVLIRVDNGSRSIGVEPLTAPVPNGTILIDLPSNIGWPAAVNLGMTIALDHGVDWTLVLNNDATVSDDCLSRCLEEATQHDRVAVVGPAVAFGDRPDKLWYAGGQVNEWFAFTRHNALTQPSASPPPSAKTGFVTGCCFVVSSEAWRALGPFRADYFAYYEDAEWCQRAASHGWQCRYVGKVLCVHNVSSTWGKQGSGDLSAGMAYYLARNPLRFAFETRPLGRRLTRIAGIMTIWSSYFAWRAIKSGDWAMFGAYLTGLSDGLRGHMGQRALRGSR